MPRRPMGALVAAIATGLPAASAAAADFDGSKPLLCAAMRVIECPADAGCEQVPGASVGLPNFWRVDVAARKIGALGQDGRTSQIKSIDHVDGKLILQGAEGGVEDARGGTGWSAAIDQESGEMVVTPPAMPSRSWCSAPAPRTNRDHVSVSILWIRNCNKI